MSQSKSDIEDVEQFLREYRAGNKDFVLKSENKDDRQTAVQAIYSMQMYELAKRFHEDAKLRRSLTFDEAFRRVPKGLLGRRDVHKVNDLLMKDDMERRGLNVEIAAHAFKTSLDYARARHLVCDTENVTRKLKECTEKSGDYQRQLNDAQRKIIRLETMLRLHHLNPDEASSYSTDVEEGGGSH